MNARSPADLDHVYALTVTLLQYRADPNVHIATTEPMICHSQSSVFLKKSSHQVLYYYVQVSLLFAENVKSFLQSVVLLPFSGHSEARGTAAGSRAAVRPHHNALLHGDGAPAAVRLPQVALHASRSSPNAISPLPAHSPVVHPAAHS